MRLLVVSLFFLPSTDYVRDGDSFGFCLFDVNSTRNPFGTGNCFQLIALGTNKVAPEARPVISLSLSLSVPQIIRYFLIARSLQNHHRECISELSSW